VLLKRVEKLKAEEHFDRFYVEITF